MVDEAGLAGSRFGLSIHSDEHGEFGATSMDETIVNKMSHDARRDCGKVIMAMVRWSVDRWPA